MCGCSVLRVGNSILLGIKFATDEERLLCIIQARMSSSREARTMDVFSDSLYELHQLVIAPILWDAKINPAPQIVQSIPAAIREFVLFVDLLKLLITQFAPSSASFRLFLS